MLKILNEASTYKKTYKCPYCSKRDTREKLVYHVDREHEDMIPEGYTALRIIFNMIYKKDHGSCIICKGESPWNENKGRYERICENPNCHAAYTKMVDTRMINKYGKRKLLDDPEFQTKMLAGRKISGTYKFSDGGEKGYTGSYEKKALEFMDNVLNCHSWDIQTPGPIIEYEYNGDIHHYISDIYYIPYNLIIEVKDGGDNPNTRTMLDYRKKQIAKEEKIIKDKEYNYLRLTNNNFAQLLQIFAELKMSMQTSMDEKIIRIHEHMPLAMINPMPASSNRKVYVVPYMMNNVFAGTALSKGPTCDELLVIDPQTGKLKNVDAKFMKDKDYKLLELNESIVEEVLEEINKAFINNDSVESDFISKTVWSRSNNGELLEEIPTMRDRYKFIEESTITNLINTEVCFESSMNLFNENSLYSIYEDNDGIFLKNNKTGERTASRQSLEELSKYINFKYNKPEILFESTIFNKKDIYYNKDKFDSGEINLCFITGHSGSGKSTMAGNMEKTGIEKYELDDVMANKIYYTMDNLKEYGDLIYSFFKGIGSKYYYDADDVKEGRVKKYEGDYDKDLITDFVNYSINYAKSHNNKKFVIEGVWLFQFIEPSKLKDYAVYIKGTSELISNLRAAKRDSKNEFPDDKIKRTKSYVNRALFFFTKDSKKCERYVNKYRNYFSKLEKKYLTESSYIKRHILDLHTNGSNDVTLDGEIVDINDNSICPLNLSVIPNYMGINLCSVQSVEWSELPNGELIDICIKFIPEGSNLVESVVLDEYWSNNIEDFSNYRLNESKKMRDYMPKKCYKCGSTNISCYFRGEPIFECNDCKTYLGTPDDPIKSKPLNESVLNEQLVRKYSPISELNDDNIKSAFNKICHFIKWCRMDSSSFCYVSLLNDPIIYEDKSFKFGEFKGSEKSYNKVIEALSNNYHFTDGEFEVYSIDKDDYIDLCARITSLYKVIEEAVENTDYDDRENVLYKTLKVIKSLGYDKVKVSDKDKEKFCNCEDFEVGGKNLCIYFGLENQNKLQSISSEVNKVIKPFGGKLSPDNYGTCFLSVHESSINKKYDTIIFDFGGVIAKYDKNITYDYYHKYIEPDGITIEEFDKLLDSYFKFMYSKYGEYKDGKDSQILFKNTIDSKYYKYFDGIINSILNMEYIADYTESMLKSLKLKGYKLYYLSNQSKWSWNRNKKLYESLINKYFTDGIISCDVKLSKPDPAIYKLLIDRTGLNPNTSLFFDDKEENIKAAKIAGIDGIVFTEDIVKDILRFPKVSTAINESNTINELDDILEKIKDFNKELAVYEYIIVQPNGKIVSNIKSDSFKNYNILSASDFKKYNGGICWDYCVYEDQKWNFCKHKTFFFCAIDKDGNPKHTHTFLLFYINNKVYWFEASWKSHIGIFEFEDENSALSGVINKLLSANPEKDFYIVEYKPSKYVGNSESEFTLAMSKLPEYNYKEIKEPKMKTIQSIKLDNNGNIKESSIKEVKPESCEKCGSTNLERCFNDGIVWRCLDCEHEMEEKIIINEIIKESSIEECIRLTQETMLTYRDNANVYIRNTSNDNLDLFAFSELGSISTQHAEGCIQKINEVLKDEKYEAYGRYTSGGDTSIYLKEKI